MGSSNRQIADLKSMMKQQLSEIHTGMPGTVVSFDAGQCIATVKPTLQYHTADGSLMDYPLITGVPVFMPHAGDAQITYPVKAGDGCWISFSERSLDEYMGKGDADNHDPRQFDLTDAMCFVGMRPAQSISAANVEIINSATSISVTPGGDVNIVGNVNIQGNITCTGTSQMSGNITCHGSIASDGDMQAGSISLQGHIHGGVQGGGSTTSGPQ